MAGLVQTEHDFCILDSYTYCCQVEEESSEICSVRRSSLSRKSIKTHFTNNFTNRQIEQRGAAISVRTELTNKNYHNKPKRNLSKIYEEESETKSDVDKLENNIEDNKVKDEKKKVIDQKVEMNMRERCVLSRYIPITRNIR